MLFKRGGQAEENRPVCHLVTFQEREAPDDALCSCGGGGGGVAVTDEGLWQSLM